MFGLPTEEKLRKLLFVTVFWMLRLVFDWKNIIIACFDTCSDDFELYSSCFEDCMLEYADPSSVNCLDLCVQDEKRDFLADDFCFVCRRHVSFYLLVKNYHIIAKRKNGNNLL